MKASGGRLDRLVDVSVNTPIVRETGGWMEPSGGIHPGQAKREGGTALRLLQRQTPVPGVPRGGAWGQGARTNIRGLAF